MDERARVLLAPSPNWYGAHVSTQGSFERAGGTGVTHQQRQAFLAYCAQRSIVLLELDSAHKFRVHEVLSGCYNARTSCVTSHVVGDTLYLVTATQDKCVQTWVLEVNNVENRSGDACTDPCTSGGPDLDKGDVPRSDHGSWHFKRHRMMSKRPGEVKAAVSDGFGAVLLGDAKGNVFCWRLGEHGSRMERVVSGLGEGRGVVAMANFEGIEGVVAAGCADGRLVFVGYRGEFDVGVLAEVGRSGTGDGEVQGVASARISDGVYWVASGLKRGLVRVDEVVIEVGQNGGSGRVEVRRRVVDLDVMQPGVNGNATRRGKRDTGDKYHNTRFWGSVAWGRVGAQLCLFTGVFGGGVLTWWGLDGDCEPTAVRRGPRRLALPESHSRAVFRICTEDVGDSSSLLVTSVGMDRTCTAWELTDSSAQKNSCSDLGEVCTKLTSRFVGIGAYPMCIAIEPGTLESIQAPENLEAKERMRLACGCGDSTIRLASCMPGMQLGVLDEMCSQIWKDIPAPVVVISWSYAEMKRTLLAFGCEDGTVGLVDVKRRTMRLGISRHPAAVSALQWVGDNHEIVQSWCIGGVVMNWTIPSMGDDAAGNDAEGSCNSRVMEPMAITKVDLDGSRMITCVSSFPRTCSDGSLVLVGYSRGPLEARGCGQSGVVNDISVLFRYDMNDPLSSGIRMASSTATGTVVALADTGIVYVFDRAGGNPRCSCSVVAKPWESSSSMTTCVHAASWIHDGVEITYISVGFDSGLVLVLTVIDSNTLKIIGPLRGHTAPVLDMFHWKRWLVTSSQDQTVRVWDWTVPPLDDDSSDANESDLDLDETVARSTAQDDAVSVTPRNPPPNPRTAPASKDAAPSSTRLTTLLPGLTMGVANPADSDSEFMDVAAFVASSATSMAQKAMLNHHKDERQSKALSQRAAALHLWRGDVGKALTVLVENDALTSDFVAFAAGAGRDAWIAASRVYSDYLERKGEVHLAALYRVQAGDAVDACLTYERHKMHREAAALAELWLPSDHPVAIRAMEQYGTFLARAGHEAASDLVLTKARQRK